MTSTQTVAELVAALAKLQAELRIVSAEANDRATRSYKVQAITSAVVMGTATKADLMEAQAALTRSVEAMVTVQALERAIAEQEQTIAYAKGRERAGECQDIKLAFDAALERHREAAKLCLAEFREMQRLDRQWMAMVSAHGSINPLMPNFYRELHLPVISGNLGNRSNISTGAE